MAQTVTRIADRSIGTDNSGCAVTNDCPAVAGSMVDPVGQACAYLCSRFNPGIIHVVKTNLPADILQKRGQPFPVISKHVFLKIFILTPNRIRRIPVYRKFFSRITSKCFPAASAVTESIIPEFIVSCLKAAHIAVQSVKWDPSKKFFQDFKSEFLLVISAETRLDKTILFHNIAMFRSKCPFRMHLIHILFYL